MMELIELGKYIYSFWILDAFSKKDWRSGEDN